MNGDVGINTTYPEADLEVGARDPKIKGAVYDSINLDGASSVYVSGRYAYVAAYGGDRLTVVDISGFFSLQPTSVI